MGDRLVVGGHFRHAAYAPMLQGGEGNCYDNPEKCAESLRLAAFTFNGFLDTGWAPRAGPEYYGVWTHWINGSELYIGGIFSNVSGVPHRGFARLSGGA
jgi:hypothetical protein